LIAFSGEAPGRVIIASFASQIHRMQMAIDCSLKHGRKVPRWAAR
jgi:mRNA degradation ribonuclease J1/J2